MPLRLNGAHPNFEKAFVRFLNNTRDSDADVDSVVSKILRDVRGRGDAALIDYTHRFDRVDLAAAEFRFEPDEIAGAADRCAPDAVAALGLAADRIRAFHERQMPQDMRYTDAQGITLGARWTPIDAAGLYVPGGTATYPSSVLMNAIPARVAGVSRIAMVVPTPDGVVNPLVLAAA